VQYHGFTKTLVAAKTITNLKIKMSSSSLPAAAASSKTISVPQLKYISKIKNKISKKYSTVIEHFPCGDTSFGKMPCVEDFYLKPVIVWAPHLMLHDTDKLLLCPDCDGSVKSKGWQTNPIARLISGLNTSEYNFCLITFSIAYIFYYY
jgi:hypothetical protein